MSSPLDPREHRCPVVTEPTESSMARAKRYFKRYPRLYRFIVRVISPVLPISNRLPKEILSGLEPQATVLNVGSGPVQLHPKFVDVDIKPYPNVRVVSDCTHLPYPDASVDAIVSLALLEHVKDPISAVAEMRRVLKPGGRLFAYVPFMVGYHEAPGDFHRWTRAGGERLFSAFDLLDIRNCGPTSGMLWMLVEWLSILLSFGSRRLYVLWLFSLMLTLWPLKYLDLLLRKHPMADMIATGFLYVVQVPAGLPVQAETDLVTAR